MLRAEGVIAFPKLDISKFSKALNKAVEAEMKHAARAWLRAVVPLVPVYTGTARGTLRPLGQFLRVAVPIRPVEFRNRRGPEVGAAASNFKFEKRGNIFIFQWNHDIGYAILNEFYSRPNPPYSLKNPTPWNAVVAGNAAWNDYVKNTLPKNIPRLNGFVEFQSRRLGG